MITHPAADVLPFLQLIDRTTNTPVYLPDVKVKLYVIKGQQLAPSSLLEAPCGLYLSDDGTPLFAAANTAPEEDGGVPIELTAVGLTPFERSSAQVYLCAAVVYDATYASEFVCGCKTDVERDHHNCSKPLSGRNTAYCLHLMTCTSGAYC